MDSAFKVMNKVAKTHPQCDLLWRDGQFIECGDNGKYDGSQRDKIDCCIIRTTEDYWTTRGSTDWKSTLPQVLEFNKKYYTAHQQGGRGFSSSFSDGFNKSDHKYPWEVGYVKPGDNVLLRTRDWYVDFKWLLDDGHITQAQYDSIYDRTAEHLPISLPLTLPQILRHEDNYSRRDSVHLDEVEVFIR